MIIFWACLGLLLGVVVNWLVDSVPSIRPHVQTGPGRPNGKSRIYLWTAVKNLWPIRSCQPESIEPVKLGVELCLVIFFPLVFWFEGDVIAAWQKLVLGTILLLIALIDMKYRLVLNPVLIGTGIVALIFMVLQADDLAFIQNALVGGFVALTLFFLAGQVSRGRLGGGDIKLAFIIGFIFGFPHLFWPLLLGTTLGALQGLGLLVLKSQKNRLYAFAPALCLGAGIALFFPI